MASIKPSAPQLYEDDYYAWVQDQVRALRERRIEEIDWENVAEEVDDLGKSVRWSIQNHLETLVEHLIKLAHTQGSLRARNARLWTTVRLARTKIRRQLRQNPSLRPKMSELFQEAYEDGRTRGLATIDILEKEIPAMSPWTLEQVLDDSFWPKPAE